MSGVDSSYAAASANNLASANGGPLINMRTGNALEDLRHGTEAQASAHVVFKRARTLRKWRRGVVNANGKYSERWMDDHINPRERAASGEARS